VFVVESLSRVQLSHLHELYPTKLLCPQDSACKNIHIYIPVLILRAGLQASFSTSRHTAPVTLRTTTTLIITTTTVTVIIIIIIIIFQ